MTDSRYQFALEGVEGPKFHEDEPWMGIFIDREPVGRFLEEDQADGVFNWLQEAFPELERLILRKEADRVEGQAK